MSTRSQGWGSVLFQDNTTKEEEQQSTQTTGGGGWGDVLRPSPSSPESAKEEAKEKPKTEVATWASYNPQASRATSSRSLGIEAGQQEWTPVEPPPEPAKPEPIEDPTRLEQLGAFGASLVESFAYGRDIFDIDDRVELNPIAEATAGVIGNVSRMIALGMATGGLSKAAEVKLIGIPWIAKLLASGGKSTDFIVNKVPAFKKAINAGTEGTRLLASGYSSGLTYAVVDQLLASEEYKYSTPAGYNTTALQFGAGDVGNVLARTAIKKFFPGASGGIQHLVGFIGDAVASPLATFYIYEDTKDMTQDMFAMETIAIGLTHMLMHTVRARGALQRNPEVTRLQEAQSRYDANKTPENQQDLFKSITELYNLLNPTNSVKMAETVVNDMNTAFVQSLREPSATRDMSRTIDPEIAKIGERVLDDGGVRTAPEDAARLAEATPAKGDPINTKRMDTTDDVRNLAEQVAKVTFDPTVQTHEQTRAQSQKLLRDIDGLMQRAEALAESSLEMPAVKLAMNEAKTGYTSSILDEAKRLYGKAKDKSITLDDKRLLILDIEILSNIIETVQKLDRGTARTLNIGNVPTSGAEVGRFLLDGTPTRGSTQIAGTQDSGGGRVDIKQGSSAGDGVKIDSVHVIDSSSTENTRTTILDRTVEDTSTRDTAKTTITNEAINRESRTTDASETQTNRILFDDSSQERSGHIRTDSQEILSGTVVDNTIREINRNVVDNRTIIDNSTTIISGSKIDNRTIINNKTRIDDTEVFVKEVLEPLIKAAKTDANKAKKSTGNLQKVFNAITESRGAIFLGNFTTWSKNITSQSLQAAFEVGSRYAGAMANKLVRAEDGVSFREANAALTGHLEGMYRGIFNPIVGVKDLARIEARLHGGKELTTVDLAWDRIINPKKWESLITNSAFTSRQKVEGMSNRAIDLPKDPSKIPVMNLSLKFFDWTASQARLLGYGTVELSDRPFGSGGYFDGLNTELVRMQQRKAITSTEASRLRDLTLEWHKYKQIVKHVEELELRQGSKFDTELVTNIIHDATGGKLKGINKADMTLLKKLDDVAMQQSNHLTYKDEIQSDALRKIEEARGQDGFIGFGLKVMMPFYHTPTRILENWWHKSPLSTQLWRDIMGKTLDANGHVDRYRQTKSMGQLAVSMGLYTVGYTLWQNGLLTATARNADERRTMREAGIPEGSIRIGNRWFQINGYDPAAMYLSTTANIMRTWEEADDKESLGSAGDLAMQFVVSVALDVTSNSWATGVRDMIDVLASGDEEAASRFFQNLGSSLNPLQPVYNNATRVSLGGLNPLYKTHLEDMDWKKLVTEGQVSTVPRLDTFGKPILNYQNVAGTRYITPTDSPVRRELVKLDMSLPRPSRTINGVRLTDEQYYEMQRYIETVIKGEDKLNRIVADSRYVNPPRAATDAEADMYRKKALRDEWNNTLNAAREHMKKDPEIVKAILEHDKNLRTKEGTDYRENWLR